MSPVAWFCGRARSILLVDYQASADALGVYRIAFALSFLLLVGIPSISWIAEVPGAFFDPPPGLPRVMPGFPPKWVLVGADYALIGLFGALVIGWRTRFVSVAITLLMLYGSLFRFSFGKIDHDFLILVTPALFATSWGASFSLDARSNREPRRGNALSRGLLACLLTYGFLTAGLPKLASWLDFDLSTHGVMSWVEDTGVNDRNAFLVPVIARLENPWIWEALDLGAVAFELSVVVALFAGPAAFGAWCVVAVLFHLTTYLILNIDFLGHLPLYLAFLDWEPAARRLRAFADRSSSNTGIALLTTAGVGAAAIVAITRFSDSSLFDLFEEPLAAELRLWKALVILALAAAIAIAAAARSFRQRRSHRRGIEAPVATSTDSNLRVDS